jgi:hypothetical protein
MSLRRPVSRMLLFRRCSPRPFLALPILSPGASPVPAIRAVPAPSGRGFRNTAVRAAAEGLSVEEYVNVSGTTMEALYDALDAYAEENVEVDLGVFRSSAPPLPPYLAPLARLLRLCVRKTKERSCADRILRRRAGC